MEKLLSDIYYSPGKFTNTKELFKLARKEDPYIKFEDVKEWIDKQTIHQITKKQLKNNKI